ncbi:hypothetical protein [Streptomyces sp. NPDC051214]|uniref:hypothetical protein n=1 Tax=Streptomyces sp. NPDC051214 TaxID=3155282 RepID=UPI0034462CD9
MDAPALEFAEQAVRSLVEEVLERSELLADWTVERCEVELHPDLAKKSLDAADGPDASPADVEARRAQLTEPGADTAVDPARAAAEAKIAERRMRALAVRLRAFEPGMFGAVDEEDEGYDADTSAYAVSLADAELAAGALVWAIDVLLDELFQDTFALDSEETNVAECDQ